MSSLGLEKLVSFLYSILPKNHQLSLLMSMDLSSFASIQGKENYKTGHNKIFDFFPHISGILQQKNAIRSLLASGE